MATATSGRNSVADATGDMIPVAQAIARCGIGRWKFYELLRNRQITHLKIGNRVKVSLTSLNAFIQKHTVVASDA